MILSTHRENLVNISRVGLFLALDNNFDIKELHSQCICSTINHAR